MLYNFDTKYAITSAAVLLFQCFGLLLMKARLDLTSKYEIFWGTSKLNYNFQFVNRF